MAVPGAPSRPPEPVPGLLHCLSSPRALLLGKAAPRKGPQRSINGAAGAPNYLAGEVSRGLPCETCVLTLCHSGKAPSGCEGATGCPKERDDLEAVGLEGAGQGGPEWGPTGTGWGFQMLSTGTELCEVHCAVGRAAVL